MHLLGYHGPRHRRSREGSRGFADPVQRHLHIQGEAGGVTGIYGLLLQASDSRANLELVGAEPVSNEKVTDFTVDDTAVTFELKKWPLAAPVGDNGLTGDMKAAVKVRRNSGTASFLMDDPTSTTTAEVASIDWKAGTVTMTLKDSDGEDAVKAATGGEGD